MNSTQNGSSKPPRNRPKFEFVLYSEDAGKEPIFCITFNSFVIENIFAATGGNRVTVYKIVQNDFEPILCIADKSKTEIFYTCAWGWNKQIKESVLLAGGANGLIRIIVPSSPLDTQFLSGHGGAINELKVSPINSELVLSASQDHSLRFWNIVTNTCIAIFGGVDGHRDEILSACFHLSGDKVVSAGMDHALKVWYFDKDVLAAIELSNTFDDATSKVSFPTVRRHFPYFSTRDIHKNYVDSVTFFGNFIWSKSCENQLLCWRPGKPEDHSEIMSNLNKYTTNTTCTILETLEVADCDLWWIKFSLDCEMKYLALGNKKGKTYVFDVDPHDRDGKPPLKTILYHSKCNSAIRQTCFSNDGKILLCSDDAGRIWRWDRV